MTMYLMNVLYFLHAVNSGNFVTFFAGSLEHEISAMKDIRKSQCLLNSQFKRGNVLKKAFEP